MKLYKLILNKVVWLLRQRTEIERENRRDRATRGRTMRSSGSVSRVHELSGRYGLWRWDILLAAPQNTLPTHRARQHARVAVLARRSYLTELQLTPHAQQDLSVFGRSHFTRERFVTSSLQACSSRRCQKRAHIRRSKRTNWYLYLSF